MQLLCLKKVANVRRVYCGNILGVVLITVVCNFCSITGSVITTHRQRSINSFTTPSQNKPNVTVGITIGQLSTKEVNKNAGEIVKTVNLSNSTKSFTEWNSSTTASNFEGVSQKDDTENATDELVSTKDYNVTQSNVFTTSMPENVTVVLTEHGDLSTQRTGNIHTSNTDVATAGVSDGTSGSGGIPENSYSTTQTSVDTTSGYTHESTHQYISIEPSTEKVVQKVQNIAKELNLVQHYTEFIKTSWLAEKHRHHAVDHHLNLIPIEDGPFGSLIWRDKKYLISVLIPIGVGIAGAVFIVVMAYAVRYCHRGEQTSPKSPIHIPQVSMKSTPTTDQVVLLADSSDDEF